jgi:hypothetical protein
MTFANENECYAQILCGHLREMVCRLRQIPDDKWDWTFAPPAPTPRILAAHALQWLVCDRQHIAEPDVTRHVPVPEAPAQPSALCDALARETNEWERLLRALTPEQLDRPGMQFGFRSMNVRGFIGHMVQNSIYKNGQLATLFFGLGLDGDAPYEAPFPNTIYEQTFDTLSRPLHQAALAGDLDALNRALRLTLAEDVNAPDSRGITALMCAAVRGHEDIVQTLLTHGADPTLRGQEGQHNAADFARFGGHRALAERLTALL